MLQILFTSCGHQGRKVVATEMVRKAREVLTLPACYLKPKFGWSCSEVQWPDCNGYGITRKGILMPCYGLPPCAHCSLSHKKSCPNTCCLFCRECMLSDWCAVFLYTHQCYLYVDQIKSLIFVYSSSNTQLLIGWSQRACSRHNFGLPDLFAYTFLKEFLCIFN